MKTLALLFAVCLFAIGCSPKEPADPSGTSGPKVIITASEINAELDAIAEYQAKLESETPNFKTIVGRPITAEQAPLVFKLLAAEFLPIYERYNGRQPFGVLVSLYSIEEIEKRPDNDYEILSQMQGHYPNLKQNAQAWVSFASGGQDNFYFNRETGIIAGCFGGEEVEYYANVLEWLKKIKNNLQQAVDSSAE